MHGGRHQFALATRRRQMAAMVFSVSGGGNHSQLSGPSSRTCEGPPRWWPRMTVEREFCPKLRRLRTALYSFFFRFSNAANHSLARFWASASCAGVIFWASASLHSAFIFCWSPDSLAAARPIHLHASTTS
jgi:hypothetical protein